MKRVAVRGLARLAGLIFFIWGAIMTLKGLWDCLGGQPEANAFSSQPWGFVTKAQWFRYAGFELAYGLACLSLGGAAVAFSRKLPEWIERERIASYD